MTDDAVGREAKELYEKYIRSTLLSDLRTLHGILPKDPMVLRRLQARCLEEARKEMTAGHHMEGRRLSNLAREFQRLAEN